jgi:hypothetical protein
MRNRLLNSPQIIHWFAENHDMQHPKLSTLPTGLVGENPDERADFPDQILPLHKRPLLVMNADRIRRGSQWVEREEVFHMCQNASFCMQPFEGAQARIGLGVTHKDFLSHLASVPFILCVHGGGIDPSPKAWESLLVGTIPIIRHSTCDDAYSQLPVAFVNNWSDLFQSSDPLGMLQRWVDELAPYYEEGSRLRNETLEVSNHYVWSVTVISSFKFIRN